MSEWHICGKIHIFNSFAEERLYYGFFFWFRHTSIPYSYFESRQTSTLFILAIQFHSSANHPTCFVSPQTCQACFHYFLTWPEVVLTLRCSIACEPDVVPLAGFYTSKTISFHLRTRSWACLRTFSHYYSISSQNIDFTKITVRDNLGQEGFYVLKPFSYSWPQSSIIQLAVTNSHIQEQVWALCQTKRLCLKQQFVV